MAHLNRTQFNIEHHEHNRLTACGAMHVSHSSLSEWTQCQGSGHHHLPHNGVIVMIGTYKKTPWVKGVGLEQAHSKNSGQCMCVSQITSNNFT